MPAQARFSQILPALAMSLLAVAALAIIAAPLMAQQQQGRLSRECRQEIVQLCGRDRGAIRACLQERLTELSEDCTAELRERMGMREQREQQPLRPYEAPALVSQSVLYGSDIRQQVDIYKPQGAIDDLPLVLFVHGGGWSMGSHKLVQSKPRHFNEADHIFASTGYRLLPDAPVEEQAADVGAALQALVGQADAIGIDAERIVLMGHSAGAHLAALVASDPTYAGEAFGAIRGVVLLDGAAYDVAANMAQAGPQAWQIYNAAFGNEPARQAALSPITHVGGPDAPHWMALHVEDREEARNQAEALVAALGEAGVSAQAVAIAGTDHGRMNREIGTEAGAAQTQAIDAFLGRVLR
jgi:acetyl esterase/lipase